MQLSLLILCTLFTSSASLQCYVLNTLQGISSMVCPANVYQCMKFTCDVGGSEQVYKGCNDLSNPPISCSNLLSNCMSMNGKGRCHVCQGEMCNASPSLSILPSLLLSLLSLSSLLTLF